MYFGNFVGWRLNETLSDVYSSMVGEWLWTKAAFGDFADNEGYVEIYRDNLEAICKKAGCSLEDLHRLRETEAPAFIDFCLIVLTGVDSASSGFRLSFNKLWPALL